jgi:glycosyltransferase involved in cell wall biosynthesis
MAALEQFSSYLRAAWSPEEVGLIVGRSDLDEVIARQGIAPCLVGRAPGGERVAIGDAYGSPATGSAPSTFRVAAIVPVFNEADVIRGTLEYLVADGVGVYVVDDWSTDATLDIVREFAGRGLLGVERFPASGAPRAYDLRAILGRVEDLAAQIDADWLVLHDADERRRGQWPGPGLWDTLHHVERSGFTCIDHVTLTFWPIDEGYDGASHDVESYFSFFEFSDHPGHFHQRRAWKNLGQRVALADTAGHDVRFAGRRVYPYKLLLKHYPIRSQAHGERKIQHERRERWNAAERSLGWHRQYDQVERFVRQPSELHRFDPERFYEDWFVERHSGVGIFREPPAWATPPTLPRDDDSRQYATRTPSSTTSATA